MTFALETKSRIWHKDGQFGIKVDKLAEILEQAHFLPLSE